MTARKNPPVKATQAKPPEPEDQQPPTRPAVDPDPPIGEDPPVDPDPHAGEDQAVAPDCPTPEACFPHGVPAGTYSAGCQHGTWTLTE